MSDPFVRMGNHDIGGYPECEWHVMVCGLPTDLTALVYPTIWNWNDRESFLNARSRAYRQARLLADSLDVRFIEEFSENDIHGIPLPGTTIESASEGDEKK